MMRELCDFKVEVRYRQIGFEAPGCEVDGEFLAVGRPETGHEPAALAGQQTVLSEIPVLVQLVPMTLVMAVSTRFPAAS